MVNMDGTKAFFSHARHHTCYTLGPPLRILHVKNVGKDLAPEELRICPLLAGGPTGQQIFAILDANTQKSFKKSRAARAKVDMQKDNFAHR